MIKLFNLGILFNLNSKQAQKPNVRNAKQNIFSLTLPLHLPDESMETEARSQKSSFN